MAAVSDVLLLTLGLLAAVVGCLAKPCSPSRWSVVKAPRVALEAAAEAPEAVVESAPASEPGFADGLTAPA